MRECLKEHEESPVITLKTHVKLAINSIHLTFSLTFSEKRTNEKLSEAVKSSLETFVGAVEVVVGVCQTCVCVVHATLVFDVGGVLFFVRVLFCSHEEHVLGKVSRAIKWGRVQGTSYVHIE